MAGGVRCARWSWGVSDCSEREPSIAHRTAVTDRFATSDGLKLRYRVDGPADAPALLLSHALGTTLELWAPQVSVLASRFRVIRYDTRGHGRSDIPSGEYSIEDLGRDALAVLDAERAQTACVVGISLGGLTAMWLGVHAGARVRALVLANTAARVGTTERWVERAALVRSSGMGAIADMAMGTWFTEEFRGRSSATVEGFRRTVASTSPEGYTGCCTVLRDADLRAELSRVGVPTLVIAGSRDVSTPLAEARSVADRIPGSTQLILECAHLSNVECADAFTKAVEEFCGASG